jgi:hypothetical protein
MFYHIRKIGSSNNYAHDGGIPLQGPPGIGVIAAPEHVNIRAVIRILGKAVIKPKCVVACGGLSHRDAPPMLAAVVGAPFPLARTPAKPRVAGALPSSAIADAPVATLRRLVSLLVSHSVVHPRVGMRATPERAVATQPVRVALACAGFIARSMAAAPVMALSLDTMDEAERHECYCRASVEVEEQHYF